MAPTPMYTPVYVLAGWNITWIEDNIANDGVNVEYIARYRSQLEESDGLLHRKEAEYKDEIEDLEDEIDKLRKSEAR